jgi:hypothetical protein
MNIAFLGVGHPHVFPRVQLLREMPDVAVAVGTLRHEDVAAAFLDYPDKIVTVDVTAWEPAYWCADWAFSHSGC